MELQSARIGSSISKNLIECLRKKITQILNEQEQIRHDQVSDFVKYLSIKKDLIENVSPAKLKFWYTPIIESGGQYSCSYGSKSNDRVLSPDIIICSLAIRYNSTTSVITRTFFCETDNTVQENYNFAFRLLKYVSRNLLNGMKLSELYQMAKNYVSTTRPDLSCHVLRNFGFMTGEKFCYQEALINAKSKAEASESQVFVINVGLKNLKNDKGEDYAIFIGDTVIVNKLGASASVITKSKKRWENVFIPIEEGYVAKNESEIEKLLGDLKIALEQKFQTSFAQLTNYIRTQRLKFNLTILREPIKDIAKLRSEQPEFTRKKIEKKLPNKSKLVDAFSTIKDRHKFSKMDFFDLFLESLLETGNFITHD